MSFSFCRADNLLIELVNRRDDEFRAVRRANEKILATRLIEERVDIRSLCGNVQRFHNSNSSPCMKSRFPSQLERHASGPRRSDCLEEREDEDGFTS